MCHPGIVVTNFFCPITGLIPEWIVIFASQLSVHHGKYVGNYKWVWVECWWDVITSSDFVNYVHYLKCPECCSLSCVALLHRGSVIPAVRALLMCHFLRFILAFYWNFQHVFAIVLKYCMCVSLVTSIFHWLFSSVVVLAEHVAARRACTWNSEHTSSSCSTVSLCLWMIIVNHDQMLCACSV